MSEKSYVGADNAYFAIITDDPDAYSPGTPEPLAPLINVVHTPKVNSKTQYANNQAYDALSSEGETEIEVEITGMPLSRQAVLTGKTYDAATGRMFDGNAPAPYVAIGFRALKSDGTYRYFWYLKCRPQAPTEEQATKTDTPEFKQPKMKFLAIYTNFQFDQDGSTTDSNKRVVGDTEDDNFDPATWFDNVQVPSVGAPDALNMTPSPADGASGVAVGVSPTLTFTNPMNANVLNGIALLKVSDDSPVSCTISINAARTVVTIDPASNLTASTEFYIVVVNATDIYGQVLANTVVNFNTA